MSMVDITDAIIKSADWWADRVSKGYKEDFPNQFRREWQKPLPVEQSNKFARSLMVLINREMLRQIQQRGTFFVVIDCEYHPDPVLEEAAMAAEIKGFGLRTPWKTMMIISPVAVYVCFKETGGREYLIGEPPTVNT